MRKFVYLLLLFTASPFLSNGQSVIKGHVFTADGQPVAGVTLRLIEFPHATLSNEAGEFRFNKVPAGKYLLRVSHTGLHAQELELEVDGSATLQKNIVLSQNNQQLTEVVVSSSKGLNRTPVNFGKMEISPMDLPQSISVINSSIIKQQQAQRLSDVVKNVNGVYLASTRGAALESFSARGYGFSSTNMFKNGARVNTGGMPEMSSLEKVEILKGGAAVLFGNVAPGGILNMVTKKPRFSQGGEISVRTGSYGLLKPMLDIYGPVSKKFAYRLNGTFERTESYRDVVRSKKYYVNPSLLFKPGKNTEILLQGDFLKQDFTPDFGIGSLADTLLSGLTHNVFLGTYWQYNKIKQSSINLNLTQRLNDNWNVLLTTGFQRYDRDYYSIERIQAKANGSWARPLNKILQDETYLNGEVNINGKFNTGNISHALVAGIDIDKTLNNAFSFDQPLIYDTINILVADKANWRSDVPLAEKIRKVTTPSSRFGIYLQDLVSISEKIKLLAGMRYSAQVASPASTLNLKDKSLVTGVKKTDDAFSPRLGIVYQPVSTISLFSSFSNSFVINSGTDVLGNTLSPSIINQFEAGIKNELFNKHLSLNITAYLIHNNNLAQTAPFAADGVTPNNNTTIKALVGETKSKGIELDIMGKPIKYLQVIAGYSYNDMRYLKTPEGKGNYIAGERLVNNPKNTANMSLNYDLTKWLKGLYIGTGAYYTGSRKAGWNNTQGQAQSFSRIIPIAGYTTVDLSFGYLLKNFRTQLKITNLTNTRNWVVHENYSVNPIVPASLTATVTYQF